MTTNTTVTSQFGRQPRLTVGEIGDADKHPLNNRPEVRKYVGLKMLRHGVGAKPLFQCTNCRHMRYSECRCKRSTRSQRPVHHERQS